ncbi:30 kDa heat shock protein [Xylariales sp. AK1849]|nr:30 kDa heat shock protein [Xylariales sp. AK1849]
MASFFGRPQYLQAPLSAPEPNFHGLFRLLDDFNDYSSQTNCRGQRPSRQTLSFTPKFDMRESESAFELHGELPGIDKQDIHIEFTDPQTLLVRGKTERSQTAGTPPAGLLDNKPDEVNGDDLVVVDHASDTTSIQSHKATVEDDPEESAADSVATDAQSTPASTVAEVAKPAEQALPKAAAPRHKYYLVERSIGHFSRSFTFPTRVDSESVHASLDNGVLTITIQKAKKHESRRIAIN